MAIFSGGEGWGDIAKDVAIGGIAAAAGLYIYNRFIGQPLVNLFHMAGKYAGVVAAAVTAAAFDYIAPKTGNEMFGRGLEVAGYAILGLSLKDLIPGDPPVRASGSKQVSARSWQSLSPIPLRG